MPCARAQSATVAQQVALLVPERHPETCRCLRGSGGGTTGAVAGDYRGISVAIRSPPPLKHQYRQLWWMDVDLTNYTSQHDAPSIVGCCKICNGAELRKFMCLMRRGLIDTRMVVLCLALMVQLCLHLLESSSDFRKGIRSAQGHGYTHTV